jgi:hypothetical protein
MEVQEEEVMHAEENEAFRDNTSEAGALCWILTSLKSGAVCMDPINARDGAVEAKFIGGFLRRC